ncbi:MAG TPA: tetratricopeptide repeat protein [Gemmatimonadales bacterium]|jgi:tetratricopeptide (TPR) repeat protein
MTLHKLKVAALQHEQREDWAAAIQLYRQAIREAEGGAEGGDPSLYNRIGDLAHKAGDDTAACEAWEQAVSRYGDLGFLNSAVALCGKILRVAPQRLQTFLELARLHARKRVLYDVQANLQLYLDQMAATGRTDAARTAVGSLGDEFPGWRDLDALIDQLLGREGLAEPVRDDRAPGEAGRGLVFLDTGPMQIERASEPADAFVPDGAVDGTSVVDGLELTERPEALPFAELESLVSEPSPDDGPRPGADVAAIAGLVGTATTARDLPPIARLEGLDDAPIDADGSGTSPISGLEGSAVVGSDEADQGSPHASLVAPDETGASTGGELVFLATDSDAAGPDPLRQDDHDPDPLGDRLAAHAMLEGGDRASAIGVLEQSLAGYESQSEWLHAYQVASELVEAEPQSINRHQTRVEMAARLGDQARLRDAYADLGDTLVRLGSDEKAVAVYRRILEINDGDERARAALRAMAPESTAEPTPDGFIDLGAMLIDDHPTSTRMRTEMPAVAPDEQDTFRDALAEFKRAIDQNLPIEDHQAHYDLGIAFKEMGLLDEAISEFQKALRAPERRLRTSEALGESFFEQGRPAVAEAVLRGVENSSEGDAEKIGVLYWLGRALEAQGRRPEAIQYYQRIIAVDVGFRDATQRLSAPEAGAEG